MGMVGKTLKALGTGLDMAHASRMQRAQDMGFDTSKTYYHGTQKNFDEFQQGKPAFFAPDTDLPNQFSQMRSGDGGSQVIPAHLNVNNTFDYRNSGDMDALESVLSERGQLLDTDIYGKEINKLEGVRRGEFNMVEDPSTQQALKDLGYDSFNIRELPEREAFNRADRINSAPMPKDEAMELYNRERGRYSDYGGGVSRLHPSIERVGDDFSIGYQGDSFSGVQDPGNYKMNIGVLDPSSIRSVNAAFDPANKGSANLLASAAGAGVLGTSMLPQDAAAWEETLANPYSQRIEATNQRPAFIEAARNIREYTESPLGGSWLEGVADLAEKIGWDEARGIMDYINAGLDVAP